MPAPDVRRRSPVSRLHSRHVISAASLLAAVLVSTPTNAQTFSDGDFASWTFGATGTATVTREVSGGNPGPRLNITTVSGSTVHGTAINSLWTTSGALVGTSFTLSVDFLSGPGAFGQGQALGLLMQQGNGLYYSQLGVTGTSASWSNFSRAAVFNPLSFGLIAGSGPLNPLLTGGTLTKFGFAGLNTASGTLTNYYDNVRLTIAPVTTVPEPTTLVLLTGGLLGVGVIARRRRQ